MTLLHAGSEKRLAAAAVVDLELAESVDRALAASGYAPLRNLRVSAHHGTVLLSGRVPTYYLKQVAQSIALITAGVRELENHVDVV